MVKEMCRAQNSTISTYGYHQVDIRQMLSIQLYSIHATEIYLMLLQHLQQIINAFLVGLVSLF